MVLMLQDQLINSYTFDALKHLEPNSTIIRIVSPQPSTRQIMFSLKSLKEKLILLSSFIFLGTSYSQWRQSIHTSIFTCIFPVTASIPPLSLLEPVVIVIEFIFNLELFISVSSRYHQRPFPKKLQTQLQGNTNQAFPFMGTIKPTLLPTYSIQEARLHAISQLLIKSNKIF